MTGADTRSRTIRVSLFAVDVANRLADSPVLVHLVSIVANAKIRFFTGSVKAVGTNRFANVIVRLGARIIRETLARVGRDAFAVDAIRIANRFAVARIGHSVVRATNLLLTIGGIELKRSLIVFFGCHLEWMVRFPFERCRWSIRERNREISRNRSGRRVKRNRYSLEIDLLRVRGLESSTVLVRIDTTARISLPLSCNSIVLLSGKIYPIC